MRLLLPCAVLLAVNLGDISVYNYQKFEAKQWVGGELKAREVSVARVPRGLAVGEARLAVATFFDGPERGADGPLVRALASAANTAPAAGAARPMPGGMITIYAFPDVDPPARHISSSRVEVCGIAPVCEFETARLRKDADRRGRVPATAPMA